MLVGRDNWRSSGPALSKSGLTPTLFGSNMGLSSRVLKISRDEDLITL